MARAKRHFIPGYVWHITHRSHKREFLLKFAKDRHRYLQWLFQAKKRYDLIILDYVVTSNHIHLLVQDAHGPNVIPRSIQLVTGRVGQEFNNYEAVSRLSGFNDFDRFQSAHRRWVQATLSDDKMQRKDHWTQSITPGR